MKRIIYVLVILGTTLVGCNPLEDIYTDIDAQDTGVVGSDTYTLTADDYNDLELTFGSFNSEEEAKTLLPDFLSGAYPYFGDGSSVLVGYNLYVGSAEGISDFTGSDIFTLANSDYPKADLKAIGFYPNENPADFIGDILDAQYADPVEGQIVLAKYKQYTETPVEGFANIVDYNFAGSLEDWTPVEDGLDAGAVWTSQSGYVQGNGFFNGGATANIEWLVSPAIDLSGQTNLKFQIAHALKYYTDASLLKILVSTDYVDDVATATWDEITLATAPGVDSLDPSENYDFSPYDGETIHVAFKYESTDTDAGRWRIASLAIKTPGVTGDTASKGDYFMYTDGAWEAVEGVYFLSSADFDSMGTGAGQPGQYNNFSSSISPDNYMPTFLDVKYPYAQEEDEIIAIYDYYSSSTGAQRRGNLYTVTDGVWLGHQSTISTTLQFGVENGVFVPDNTIKYTLTNADYEYIGNTLADDNEYSGIVSTLINYHDYDSSWSQKQIVYSLGVLLDHIDPNAAEEQKYLMTYLVYSGGIAEISLTLIKTDGVWVLKS